MNKLIQNHASFPFTGVLAKTGSAQTVWEDINNIDLSRVEKKLIAEKDWSSEETNLALESYRLFLFLSYAMKEQGLTVVPFKKADEVWHAHILQSVARYTEEIKSSLGFFLDHVALLPNEASTEVDSSVLMADALKLGYVPMMIHTNAHANCDGHAMCEAGDQ